MKVVVPFRTVDALTFSPARRILPDMRKPPSHPRLLGMLILLLYCLHSSGRAAPSTVSTSTTRESLVPIRPGSPGAAPFWNEHARQFMVAPAFDFKRIPGATRYRFSAMSPGGTSHTFEGAEPWAPLTPIWTELPVGATFLRVEGLRQAGGEVIGLAGERKFHRAAVFNGPYGRALVPYAESASTALAGLLHEDFVQHWRKTGEPDPNYPLYRYAAKLIGSLLTGCSLYAKQTPRPDDAATALEIGRRSADFLIGISAPGDTPLAYFPPTYHGAKPTERENDHWTMLMSPAEAGQGYLDLYAATRDARYLEAATRIAATYGRLQLPSGTWNLKVDNRTGAPIADIQLIPSVVITFLDRLITEHRDAATQRTLDRAVAWMMANPARTFNWQAQFDDAKVRGAYQNLSKHEACEFAGYLFRHFKSDRPEAKLAEEILRFAEDQFVVWEQPPELGQQGRMRPENWFTPCSLEQYAMFEPISGSSAFMIVTFVRAYQATGNPLYLAKAESLGNALTAAQQYHHGRYPTRLVKDDAAYWANSTVNTVRAMQMLAAARGEKLP